jgi:hypothetical protein
VVVVAAVAGLNSPVAEGPALAVPAPVASITPSVAPTSESPTAEQVERSLQAARAEQAKAASRNAERAQLAASKQAAKRAKTLDQQRRSIVVEAKRIRARAEAEAEAEAEAKAAAEREAEEAAAAQKRALANRGYEPGVTDPREIARQIMKNKFGYDDDDYSCFNNVIIRESMWKIDATNPSSGAYGIPQALPGSKMASAGSDWRTNPATQIIWALDYMKKRYGSPCEAWSFKRGHGWY